ncbi:hypothetical protein MRX96_051528 [Rhipicephalus microplus]
MATCKLLVGPIAHVVKLCPPPWRTTTRKCNVGRRGSLEAAATSLGWLALAGPTWAPVCLAECVSCLKRVLSAFRFVGGNPAAGLGFLFGDLLSFYHSLMRQASSGVGRTSSPRVPPFRAAAPDAVYKHK